jgi:pyrroline-5-carboxylate reductase
MKNIDLKIGIIGLGNMGGAITRGLSASIPSENIYAYDIDPARCKSIPGIKTTLFLDELIESADIIIVAVKPDTVNEILVKLTSYKGIIVSIAAGIKIETLKKVSGSDKKIIRAMPNTPALSGCGMTVLCASENVSEDEIQSVEKVFLSTGKVLVLQEKHMDAVTGVSGSGPAYVFTFIQAMADGAVKMGLPREHALTIAAQTVFGSAKMFLDKSENPIKLRDDVASPGGTTIDAIHVLEKAGFSGIIIDAIEASALKSKELGKT